MRQPGDTFGGGIDPGPRVSPRRGAPWRAALALVLVAGSLLAGLPGRADVCVVNGSDETLLFVARAGDASRSAVLRPGERLCVSGPSGDGHASVSAYRDEEALEGCTRLVPSGRDETLLAYADFDRCAWASMTE